MTNDEMQKFDAGVKSLLMYNSRIERRFVYLPLSCSMSCSIRMATKVGAILAATFILLLLSPECSTCLKLKPEQHLSASAALLPWMWPPHVDLCGSLVTFSWVAITIFDHGNLQVGFAEAA
ncbi:hypothetical protein SAY87_009942 [Trapa incisa]|uniref:Uncharacterized protein n=1 Tax=Trapa incisa TaxID=236973 RepID=A0AAN7GDG9_9MYRT|nr:hypothetical protein SAY87_009942 [Trapa incisa]